MAKKIIAWDLGTGGNKASLYDSDGNCLADDFYPYETIYPHHGWHEQRCEDWWKAVVISTQRLIKKSKVDPGEIYCCGISGHSLGVVPIDKHGKLLKESVPIWSDCRASEQAKKIFQLYDEKDWYMKTGNGFMPPLYSAFKILWYKENEPEVYKRIDKIIGTKDYINYRLTGKLTTDPSYASGSGVWDLTKWDFSDELLNVMGLRREIFPNVVPSTSVIGQLSKLAADELGLSSEVYAVSGGVDNSCMALGSKAFKEGRLYNALGSSSWLVVSSKEPILEAKIRPFVFTHVVPGFFVSALSIGSSGTSLRWVRDNMAKEFLQEAERTSEDVYDLMMAEAVKSPIGANKLIFNPSLGGGMPLDKSPNIRGGFIGLDLVHTKADIIRSCIEGISMGLGMRLEALKQLANIGDEILLMGGGSKSALWRQIYADVYNMEVLKSNIDQQAAALGAAACAAVGTGLWGSFDKIDELHIIEERAKPIQENVQKYQKLMQIYKTVNNCLSDVGDLLNEVEFSQVKSNV